MAGDILGLRLRISRSLGDGQLSDRGNQHVIEAASTTGRAGD